MSRPCMSSMCDPPGSLFRCSFIPTCCATSCSGCWKNWCKSKLRAVKTPPRSSLGLGCYGTMKSWHLHSSLSERNNLKETWQSWKAIPTSRNVEQGVWGYFLRLLLEKLYFQRSKKINALSFYKTLIPGQKTLSWRSPSSLVNERHVKCVAGD